MSIQVEDKTYDGWKTQETWIVALWLQNDEELCRTAQEVEDIESWVRYELAPTTGLIADLTLSAIRKVDWDAIHKMLQETPLP